MTARPVADRLRLVLVLGPAVLLLTLAIFWPRWTMCFGGGALAWALVVWLLGRGRAQMGYRAAVRHLRRNDMAQAIAAMDALIRAEPARAEHYRFRAELHRLAGDLGAAERDYQQVLALAPGSPDGYLGLAEVAVQRDDYRRAQEHAAQASLCAPDDWRVGYTRALIADRLGDASAALEYAQAALSAGLTDQRLLVLVHLWRARNWARLGDWDAAQAALRDVRKAASGLRDWRLLLETPQAASLQAMVADDLRQVEALLDEQTAQALLARWSGGAG